MKNKQLENKNCTLPPRDHAEYKTARNRAKRLKQGRMSLWTYLGKKKKGEQSDA